MLNSQKSASFHCRQTVENETPKNEILLFTRSTMRWREVGKVNDNVVDDGSRKSPTDDRENGIEVITFNSFTEREFLCKYLKGCKKRSKNVAAIFFFLNFFAEETTKIVSISLSEFHCSDENHCIDCIVFPAFVLNLKKMSWRKKKGIVSTKLTLRWLVFGNGFYFPVVTAQPKKSVLKWPKKIHTHEQARQGILWFHFS